MQITLLGIEKNGVVKVATQGNITAAEINSAGPNPLQTTLGPTWSTMKVLMSMEGTSYIDSSAIGWLIGTSKELKNAGGALVLYGVQPGVKQVLDLLKVGRVVPIVDDESAAHELANAEA